jgi:trk system potassium uptake protein TrkA
MNILIVGGGKVGTSLANMLGSQGHLVTLIEMNDVVFNKLQRAVSQAERILGDGCKPQVLLDAGVRSADAVVAVTGDDEDNLVVAKLAKHEYGANRVIARVNNPKNEWLSGAAMGVDVAVSHAALLGRIIQEELSMGDLVPLLKLQRGQISLAEVTVPAESSAVGQRVDALQLPPDCVLATLLRNDQVIIPRGDTVVQSGDKIIALVKSEQQAELVRVFG